MHTMFDFTTHVKGVEYLLSLALIAGYLIVWEALKPSPFRAIKETSRDDLAHLKLAGMPGTMKQIGRIVSAPFVGVFYIFMLPFTLVGAIAYAAYTAMAGKGEAFSWRPAEAYLAGRKKTKKNDAAGTASEKK
ncbi:MAG TPA: hypothetical protein VK654_12290 [Nitrospirota bacterium]|nr:hypothetical protein [Nitrospirota bacterium]